MEIKNGGMYIFIGDGDGKGEIHRLQVVSGDMCVTWGRTGHSWMGDKEQFSKDFLPLEEEVV